MYNESMLNMISNITEVVFNIYFCYINDPSLKEDLIQEGYCKAYELLKAGNYDPNQNLRNYLFTGVRNAMTNYMYHQRKEKHSSYDLYNDNINDSDENSFQEPESSPDIDCSIDMDCIVKACLKYSSYGDYIGNVLEYFSSTGLKVPKYNGKVLEPKNIILKAILVDIIYNL